MLLKIFFCMHNVIIICKYTYMLLTCQYVKRFKKNLTTDRQVSKCHIFIEENVSLLLYIFSLTCINTFLISVSKELCSTSRAINFFDFWDRYKLVITTNDIISPQLITIHGLILFNHHIMFHSILQISSRYRQCS